MKLWEFWQDDEAAAEYLEGFAEGVWVTDDGRARLRAVAERLRYLSEKAGDTFSPPPAVHRTREPFRRGKP